MALKIELTNSALALVEAIKADKGLCQVYGLNVEVLDAFTQGSLIVNELNGLLDSTSPLEFGSRYQKPVSVLNGLVEQWGFKLDFANREWVLSLGVAQDAPYGGSEAKADNFKVYAVFWEESEAGWGCRPDGVTVHVTKALAEEYINKVHADYLKKYGNVTPGCYSRVSCGPKEVTVTRSVYKACNEKNVVSLNVNTEEKLAAFEIKPD